MTDAATWLGLREGRLSGEEAAQGRSQGSLPGREVHREQLRTVGDRPNGSPLGVERQIAFADDVPAPEEPNWRRVRVLRHPAWKKMVWRRRTGCTISRGCAWAGYGRIGKEIARVQKHLPCFWVTLLKKR